jgi:hypothetical protein
VRPAAVESSSQAVGICSPHCTPGDDTGDDATHSTAVLCYNTVLCCAMLCGDA